MLSRILAIARKELIDASRDRRTVTMTIVSAALAGPIFLMLIFNLMASQAERAAALGPWGPPCHERSGQESSSRVSRWPRYRRSPGGGH